MTAKPTRTVTCTEHPAGVFTLRLGGVRDGVWMRMRGPAEIEALAPVIVGHLQGGLVDGQAVAAIRARFDDAAWAATRFAPMPTAKPFPSPAAPRRARRTPR